MARPNLSNPALLLLAGSLSAGCGDSADAAYYEPEDSSPRTIVQSSIDTDAEIAGRAPGQSVGVFVEYQAGGHWSVNVTCDTELSGFSCAWYVLLEATGGGFSNAKARELEDADEFTADSKRVLMAGYNSDDLDGFSLSAEPGTAVRLDVALDGYYESRYLYWVGAGAVHDGAPSVPLELKPSAP